ncbi:phage tail-host specificity protein [Solidesulfovibrio carbinoliphilus subsp. oakridgensis]|uniref:Phage tail-host specificity protein n=1 Tax=Solidesulfovibrio carbinoliphilus subsp. oakridgensis TaxID=694327 RepID=G7Q5K7_9BACT|nr:hypothetical protein [Solidesulfovibrio carbinoliphilus]EHJ49566.1 phage tail-host specificity protein [Solidesulfovibrio carbinoliphilus subsp. oakridgensis]
MSAIVWLCVILAGLGHMGAYVFGLNGWSVVAVILALALWTAGVMASSMIVSVKQLEHVKIRKIVDGEEKVLVTLRLGPFGYTIDVPEEVKIEK